VDKLYISICSLGKRKNPLKIRGRVAQPTISIAFNFLSLFSCVRSSIMKGK
jgi:hypothetical protein